MRVLLDTNVLCSAFATRGLCADVLRQVLANHELLIGEVVLAELGSAMRRKLDLPETVVNQIERFLRRYECIPKPEIPADIDIRDPDDRWIIASALLGNADILVTGDRDLLDAADRFQVTVVDPRGFWTLMRTRQPPS